MNKDFSTGGSRGSRAKLLRLMLLLCYLCCLLCNPVFAGDAELIAADLADGVCELENRTYTVESTIDTPLTKEDVAILGQGRTRLVWTGPAGGVVINYRGGKGRIEDLTILGARAIKETERAGVGIQVEARQDTLSGKLTTRNVTIERCAVGISCPNEPHAAHADTLTHYGLAFYRCDTNYLVACHQSVMHTFYDVRSLGHCQRFFDFRRGGNLRVYGAYQGYAKDAVLLSLGEISRNGWPFEISGLRVDGSARGLVLVDCADEHPGRVRISGSTSPVRECLAEEPVVIRHGTGDVRIDTSNYQYASSP